MVLTVHFKRVCCDIFLCHRHLKKNGNSYSINTEATLASGENITFDGSVTVSGNILDIQHPNKRELNGNYTVIDTDYDNYAIISGCPAGGKSEAVTVQFRDLYPSDELISKIKNIFQETGHDFEDLKKSTC